MEVVPNVFNHCKYVLSGMPGPAESDSKKWVSNISGMTWGMKLIFCTWLDSHRYILIQVVVRYTWHVKSNSKYLFNSISKRNWAMVIEPLYQQIISAILSDLTVTPNCTFKIQSVLYEGLFEVYNQFYYMKDYLRCTINFFKFEDTVWKKEINKVILKEEGRNWLTYSELLWLGLLCHVHNNQTSKCPFK